MFSLMLDWNQIESLIKEVKTPITLLLTILLNYNKISKDNLDFLMRIFIRFHYKTLLNYPVGKLFVTLKIELDKNIIKFYKFYFKLIKLINNVTMIKNKFRKFKRLTIMNFTERMNNDMNVFKSFFDCSHSGHNFHTKLMNYFCNEVKNPTIDQEVIKRLRISLEFIGIRFAKEFEIKIIILKEFKKLTGFQKFKFINEYYETVMKTYKVINLNLKKIQIYKDILINLSSPRKLKVTINNTLNSETDIDDLEIFLF